ncbi:hemerythrin domain-containing protein [Vibrio genomosp. F6]|uniref:hemerythrin domain-containing protein n=1 Tax=Vibrio genomosp. F6 TaxID=723172 RepID=UPI0010BD062F|nr:hemerythrin domain-containing protein [Vibrio genomosp. F6]TKF22992.1 hemerythrin domain-containing protein [Vibrio genomosp. F6]
MMIERIRREHGYMVRLLAILSTKLKQLNNDQPINYSLVKEVVDYLANHSEKIHHPKEDVLYHYYQEHYGHQQEIENLESQHVTLSEKTHEFLGVVEMILQDAVVPREVFTKQLQEFITDQHEHLDFEEKKIIPLINRAFTTKDWQQVEALWEQEDNDPVFGETIADRYLQLAERVRQTERECI